MLKLGHGKEKETKRGRRNWSKKLAKKKKCL
jgi:hypothetical protein